MTRYFFDIREDGELTRDEDGVELETLEAARLEAQRALAEMAGELIRQRVVVSLVIEIRTGPDAPRVEALAYSKIRDLK